MVPPKINWEINLSTIIHLVILLGGVLIAYGQLSSKFDEGMKSIQETQHQVNRMEHYLMSQDIQYWQKVNVNGDNK